MTQNRLKNWLRTMVEVYAQLSEKPAIVAVYFVEITLPADVVRYLADRGAVEQAGESYYFRYAKDLSVPVKIQE